MGNSAARQRSKSVERKVCRKLGGDRSTSAVQTSAVGTNADCAEVCEYVEVKTRNEDGVSSVYDDLEELHKQALRRDRSAVMVYDAIDGPTWLAMWLDTYLEHRDEEQGIFTVPPEDLLLSPLFLIGHRVGKRLPCKTLVKDTIKKAAKEDRKPLAIMHRKGSSNYATLVPLE